MGARRGEPSGGRIALAQAGPTSEKPRRGAPAAFPHDPTQPPQPRRRPATEALTENRAIIKCFLGLISKPTEIFAFCKVRAVRLGAGNRKIPNSCVSVKD